MPIRSIKGKKSLLVKWSAFAIFALLALFLNSSYKADIFSPGELSFKHAKIEKCSACHQVFNKHFFDWAVQALSGSNTIHSSQKCLDCHQFGDNAHNAHGLSPDDLKLIMQEKKQFKEKPEQQLSCLNCHLEHHGENSDLTDVAKQNCAYCHQLEQSIINAKHPEFDKYPYTRNTRIIFDHATHANKYYYNKVGDQLLKTAPESCLSCHQTDDNGIKMLQHSYEKDCKSCHNEIFEEAESFIIFEIPELALDANELNTEWPEDANGTLTHFIVMLLATDKLFVEAVADAEDYFDLTGLDRKNTLKIITAIKNLFYEIDTQGAIVFRQRMEKALNCQSNEEGKFGSESLCEMNKTELEQLAKLFPVELFCEAKKRWFPHLANEYQKKQESAVNLSYCSNDSIAKKTEFKGWSLDGLSIEYKPEQHGDGFLHSWLNLSSRKINGSLAERARLAMFDELNSKDASVQCTKCHSVESAGNNSFKVNWSDNSGYLGKKGFIKFKHDAHIKYQDEKVCNTCHVENKNAEYLQGYEDLNPLTFQSNFKTESKDCSSCHQQSMVKEQCQLCHNYHISLHPK